MIIRNEIKSPKIAMSGDRTALYYTEDFWYEQYNAIWVY